SRSALAAVRALAEAGYRPLVARSGRWSLAAASRYNTRTVDVGPIASNGYADAIGRIARELDAATVFPSSDAALESLHVPVGHLLDKSRLIAEARRAGFAVPDTKIFQTLGELQAAAGSLPYPIVIKQPVSRVPVRQVANATELTPLLDTTGPVLVQPFMSEPLRAVGGVVWGGRLVAAVHQRYLRTWPLDCGTASAAITVEGDPDVERRLVALLDGYDGVFQAQFAGEHLLDLNPRVYGSLPLAVAAGVNLPGIAVALARGADVESVRARPGVAYRWVEGDLRALMALVRARRLGAAAALRAIAPRRDTAHSVASIRDPKPLLTRLGYVVRGRR
ncbi:MAG: ATP-grasp domain-containing protein, partial [Actinomycetota bacterium]